MMQKINVEIYVFKNSCILKFGVKKQFLESYAKEIIHIIF